jgi:hypothetical protein
MDHDTDDQVVAADGLAALGASDELPGFFLRDHASMTSLQRWRLAASSVAFLSPQLAQRQ